jgi:hypothetical protein
MMHLADNGLTSMSAVVPLTHRDFCYLKTSLKYSVKCPYGLRMIYEL